MNPKIESILIKMIRSIYLFKLMNDEQTLKLAKDFKLSFYKKGSIIFKENSYLPNMYILKNGQLDIIKATGNNNVLLGNLNPGDLFGEMSYLNKTPTMAMVVASTDCDIWEIPIKKFGEFLDNNPDIKEKVIAIKNQRELDNKTKLKFNPTEKSNYSSFDEITILF